MTDPAFDIDGPILDCARQYACLVAAFPFAHPDYKQNLLVQMDHILEQGSASNRVTKRRRQRQLTGDILSSVVARKQLNRPISMSEAEAIRLYYATPSIHHLASLSGDELSALADVMEGWAQDKRLDCRSTIELLGWSDGMRSLVDVVGVNYVPLPLPDGTKPPLFKFLATRMLKR